MTSIVGVHGIGNYADGVSPKAATQRLSDSWAKALSKQLPGGFDLKVAYYAQHLQHDVAQGPPGAESLPPAGQRMICQWASALGMPLESAQGRLTSPVRLAVDWIARKYGLNHRMVGFFLGRFCAELLTYLSDNQARMAARHKVCRTIAKQRPEVVIAHSLGSVVAYEALHSGSVWDVELLITLGSPLGMPDVVFDRLDPAPSTGFGSRPDGVRRWINLADPGDFVAVPLRLADRFLGIHADLQTPIHIFDFHKVVNYLSCTVTAAAIAPFLD